MSYRDGKAADFKDFIGLFKLVELEKALQDFNKTPEYEAIIRYYFACINTLKPERQLEPIGLLKEALAALPRPKIRLRRASELELPVGPGANQEPDLTEIHDRVEAFQGRLNSYVALTQSTPIDVPKNLHFVWLGGGLGSIQRDYINVWKQVLSHQGYTLKLWYDSDALLAHETTRVIVEAAKADAMTQGGQAVSDPQELSTLYEGRAIALKTQMFAHIKEAVEKGGKADEARIDLLVRGYGQDEIALKALLDKNLRSISIEGLELRDVRDEKSSFRLKDIYEREIGLRGNLAAASDVVRVEVVLAEGGLYSDVDNLPPLSNTLGTVDISQLTPRARLGVLQLLLDQNPEWMPGRQANKYSNHFESIPQEHRAALEQFAKSSPSLNDVFLPPRERLVRPDGLRAVLDSSSLNNAFLMAHAGSKTLETVLERFRTNYDYLDSVTRLAIKNGVSFTDVEAMFGVAREVALQRFGVLGQMAELEEMAVDRLMKGVVGYFADGILPEGDSTIYMTGPAAVRHGMAEAQKMPYTVQMAERWNAEAILADGVNRFTEEEQDHSWKVAEGNSNLWLIGEKKHWQEGRFKARYAGDVTQLLKYQSIDFEEGWPVIEGRHVLITDLLQQLADDLGEPFRQAMSQRHNGSVTFEKSLSLSFDDRQAIIAQDASIRPPASLLDAATQTLSMDELLSQVGKDPLLTLNLNPLQRLLLGGLLGVNALDNQHFAAASAMLENLANTMSELGVSHRYGIIERELFKQRHPAFLAGLTRASNPPVALSETSVELKKQALERPLTLQEWGRLVARIQQVSTLEYRDRIGERIGEVLESFDYGSFKLVPQDLLLEGAGDRVAGRCYPLALTMAAALHKSGTAANTLRERFYLAVTEPEAADSRAFVSMIEELRGAPVNEIGKPLMRSDLTEIVAMLEEKTATTTVMLNSDNHSMLVAKTLEGSHSAYLLYDPNFGIFEFATASEFGEALTHFFIRKEMARHYAAFGDVARPTFDLIELNGAGLNATVLSSGVQVSSLSEPGALPEQAAPPVRQRLASARGQSLVNNAALGSSLLELDAHWWGGQIAQATRQLQEQHGLAPDSVALFETLEITPTGEYKISLVNTDAGQTIARVTTSDHRFLRIKNFLSETFHSLAARPRAPVNPLDPTDAGSVHTLNAGFTIQALMNALRHHEGAASGGDKALTTAIRLHAYVNYAQLAHGNVVDVLGVVTLVRQALDDEKLIARTSAPLVQRALGHIANEGVGTVLGLVNVGFDIYQLSHATNEIEKAQFGTQLAFDSASALVGAAGLGAALAGAGTVAGVLGGVGVILGGLAVGVTALAEGFATIAEEAKEVARFFDGLEKAYLQGGYHLDKAANAWFAHPMLVFADLDLRASTVHFDSPKLFPLRNHFGVPDYDVDYNRAVDIRQGLGLPGSARFSPQAGQTIVLPCQPKTWYGYEYKLLPFVTFRHAGGYDTARRLEKKNEQGQWQFLFSFYSFPGEYVVNRLYPVYKPTVFNVRLDNVERSLAVPVLPKVWHGLVSYRVEGAGAQCSLLLNPGVSLELAAPGHIAMQWMLLTPWLAETDIRIDAGGHLVSGTLDVTFSGGGVHHVLLKLAGNKIVLADLVARRLEVVEEEADPALGEQALLDHFKTLTHEHRLATSYTPVRNFVVPFEKPDEPRTVVAYYDSAQDRFLYIRDPNVLESDEVILGAVLEDSAFFYHPESFDVWQVDAITGTLVQHYRLLVRDGLAIVRFEAVTNGGIQIVQQLPGKDGQRDELTYVIHDRAVLLSSITRGQDPALQAVLEADTLTDWKQVLGNYHLLAESANKVNWRPGALVSICWQIDAKSRDLVWVRSSDGLIIRAPARRHYARGWADSIKALNDLVLIAPAGVEGDVFVTYDKLHQRLMCQQRSMVDGRAQWSSSNISPPGLKNVVAVERDYLALTDSGLFFDMMPDGNLRFGGLTEHWFKGKTQWWSALATVALQYPVPSFAILGLTGFKAGLCAWYLDGRLLLAEMGHGKEVRLLSITPGNQATWLFDLSTGKIVRQGFIDPDHLSTAFAQGTKLLLAEALPAPTQEWASWTFSDVTVEGSGLRATTLEGVEVDLQYNEPVRITGVNSHWVAALEGELSKGLAALANEHRCADFLSVKDPDYQQWYVVRTGRLIRIPKTAITAQFTLVGTQHQTNVMLHDNGDGFLHTYPQNNKVGPLDYVQRNAEVLVVEESKTRTDLIPLIADDVSILVLKMGQGSTICRLTRAAWLKLQSVIVDCRHSLDHPPSVPGKLIWDIVVADQLWASRVDEHLVIVDADSGHSLIFRDVFSTDVVLQRNVFLAMSGYQSFAVSTLVSALARKGSTSSVLLKDILPTAIVEKIEN
ncbi:TcdA/TcdB pore-forming domain-containing protein [Pseudomonas sp.]|uniref:TcdA/TcdB pore-forming domain-containing protein n=1 Tax=Pseudomonas sp. TaxID=306 RepID=UPI003267C8AB